MPTLLCAEQSRFQEGIFLQTWLLKGSPLNIHGKFGEASFVHDPQLGPQHYCSAGERADAVRRFAAQLKSLLVDTQINLLLSSQPLVRGERVLEMMQCAHLLGAGQVQEGYALFEGLSKEEQSSVFFALWETSGCPRGNPHFGSEAFFSQATANRLKQQAVLLAASRQPPTLSQPLPAAPVEQPPPPPAALPTIKEGVRDAILAMLFDPSFLSLDKTAQKEQVMGYLDRLEIAVKNTLFAEVYHHSTDPQKGGPKLGRDP